MRIKKHSIFLEYDTKTKDKPPTQFYKKNN